MKKYRIVIVEDDEDERIFMKEGFDATGLFEILKQAENGNELLEWLRQHTGKLPDIVLTDLNMPGKSGFDILDYMKADPDYAHIPIIVITTGHTPFTIDKCIAKGASFHLKKPDTFIEYTPFAYDLHQLIDEKQLIK